MEEFFSQWPFYLKAQLQIRRPTQRINLFLGSSEDGILDSGSLNSQGITNSQVLSAGLHSISHLTDQPVSLVMISLRFGSTPLRMLQICLYSDPHILSIM